MNLPKENSTDKSSRIYCPYLVGFLDLLGQKEQLKKIEGIVEKRFSNEELESTLANTIGAIRRFRRHFRDSFDGFSKREIPVDLIPKDFSAEQMNKFLKLRSNSKLGIQQLSDSLIVWTPVHVQEEGDVPQILNSIAASFYATAMAIPTFLAHGIPIRGAFELEGGITIDPGGDEIYGPALNEAYRLESCEAISPRVIVGGNVLRFLDVVSMTKFKDEQVGELSIKAAARCRRFLFKDDDERFAIHFLGPETKHLMSHPDVKKDFIELAILPARKFVLDCEKKYEGDPKLLPRYRRLRSYFDAHHSGWLA